MAILLNDNLDVAVNKPTDYRYGPYESTASALQTITSIKRYKGLTVGIISGNAVKDYWFKEDITDVALIEKTSGSSGSGSAGASIVWKGEYVSGTSYVPLDAVSYNGSSYICVANTTGTEPTSIVTPLKWNLMASKGEAGSGSGSGSGVVIAGEVSVFSASLGQTAFYPINGYTSTNPNAYMVSVGGIEQAPTQNYTIGEDNGGTLFLNEAPGIGAVVLVRAAKLNAGGYFNWKGSYSAVTTYNLLDAVNYDGSSYICKSAQPILNIVPTTIAKWDVLARKGTDGSGTGGNVTQIQGRPVADTAPEAGQVLIWNDDLTQWEPGSILITGGTATFDTVGVHYLDLPSTARWARVQATSGDATDGTSGGDGEAGTSTLAGNSVLPGNDGADGEDGEDGKSILINNVNFALGGTKGLGGGGGGGGGGATVYNGQLLYTFGNPGRPAPGGNTSDGGAAGTAGVNGSGNENSRLGQPGTLGGGAGGNAGGGVSPDTLVYARSGGGGGGTNRAGGGGGGGCIAADTLSSTDGNAYPGEGGKGGTATLGTPGVTLDTPFNLTPFAGGQLIVEITPGAGNASITFTW